MKKPTFVSFINGICGYSVCVRVNGYKLADNSNFSNISDIITIWGDKVNVKVYDANENNLIINRIYNIKLGSFIHFVLSGTEEVPSLYMSETKVIPKFDREDAYIRCVNLSSSTAKMNLELSIGILLFDSVLYGEETEYRRLSPSIYNVLAKMTTGIVIGEKRGVVCLPNKNYTVFLIGDKPKIVLGIF